MMSQVKKLLPKKINKITIYLMILFIIALGGITLKGTYAKFTSSYTTPDNIVGMSLSFTLNIDNIEEYEEINVSPNSYELFNIKVTNSSNSTAYYGIWYKMVNPTTKTSDITIARSVENSTATSGSISSNNSITTTIIIKNNTSNSVKVEQLQRLIMHMIVQIINILDMVQEIKVLLSLAQITLIKTQLNQ